MAADLMQHKGGVLVNFRQNLRHFLDQNSIGTFPFAAKLGIVGIGDLPIADARGQPLVTRVVFNPFHPHA